MKLTVAQMSLVVDCLYSNWAKVLKDHLHARRHCNNVGH